MTFTQIARPAMGDVLTFHWLHYPGTNNSNRSFRPFTRTQARLGGAAQHRAYCLRRVDGNDCNTSDGEAAMRAFAIILVIATTAACGPALAQTTTPNVVSPSQGLSTPLTSTTTNCMMSCNSQAANCRATCVLPVAPTPLPSPSSSQAPILNAAANTTCIMNCSSVQMSCQSGCALNSPSR